MPKSLLVVGSGAIGIEFASFYRTLGAEVTVVEILPQILPVEDDEIAAHARKRFEKQGMKILTDAKVPKLDKGKDSVTATIEPKDGKTRDAEGRPGHLGGRRGRQCREPRPGEARREDRARHRSSSTATAGPMSPGIYAIGDVAGPPMLAHKAEHEGVVCVEAIDGQHPHAMDKLKIPGCTYCNPQIASVGLTETKAKEAGYESTSAASPSSATARRSRSASRRAW